MAKLKETKLDQKTTPDLPAEKVGKVKQTKQELLEYHLNRLDGNYLSKQEVRAVFASLLRD